MERLTLYSHYTDLTQLAQLLQTYFDLPEPAAEALQSAPAEFSVGPVEAPVLHLLIQQRTTPDYQLRAVTDDFTQNLAGMHGFISGLPLEDERLKHLLLSKITTINTQITVSAAAFPARFGAWLKEVLTSYEAFVFSEPNSIYPTGAAQGFYDEHGHLLTDTAGNSDPAAQLTVRVESNYYDRPAEYPDQADRKARSEASLQAADIPFAASLPVIASEVTAHLRTPDAVVDRALALCYLGVKSEELPAEDLADFANRYDIWTKLSPEETAYAQAITPTQQQNINANWRYEGFHVLLWSLSFVDELVYPDQACDVAADVSLLFPHSEAEFRALARLRPPAELLDAADLTYRYAWACVDARIKGQAAPANLDGSVVHERHYALNWLTGQGDDAEWDDVSTDT